MPRRSARSSWACAPRSPPPASSPPRSRSPRVTRPRRPRSNASRSSGDYAPGANCRTIDVDGDPREFIVYVPERAGGGHRAPARVHVPRHLRRRRALSAHLGLARAGGRDRPRRRLPDRPALSDAGLRPPRDEVERRRPGRADRSRRATAGRRCRLRRRDARGPARPPAARSRARLRVGVLERRRVHRTARGRALRRVRRRRVLRRRPAAGPRARPADPDGAHARNARRPRARPDRAARAPARPGRDPGDPCHRGDARHAATVARADARADRRPDVRACDAAALVGRRRAPVHDARGRHPPVPERAQQPRRLRGRRRTSRTSSRRTRCPAR